MLGLGGRTIYKLIDTGAFPAYRFGRVIRIRESDVEAFIESSRIEEGTLRYLYRGDEFYPGKDDEEAD
jgi:excisionase family DNA binding protein